MHIYSQSWATPPLWVFVCSEKPLQLQLRFSVQQNYEDLFVLLLPITLHTEDNHTYLNKPSGTKLLNFKNKLGIPCCNKNTSISIQLDIQNKDQNQEYLFSTDKGTYWLHGLKTVSSDSLEKYDCLSHLGPQRLHSSIHVSSIKQILIDSFNFS